MTPDNSTRRGGVEDEEATLLMLDVPLELGPVGRRMAKAAPSAKQTAVLAYLKINGTITTAQAADLVGNNIYHNSHKHTGALLANMIKRGMIRRAKKGVFAL